VQNINSWDVSSCHLNIYVNPSLSSWDYMFIVSMAYIWSCHRHNELTYNACLTRFCMWVQHIVCPTVVEEEKKDQIHDQNGGEPNLYVSSKDICDRDSRVLSPHRQSRRSALPPVALALGGGPRSLAGVWFHVLWLGCFSLSSSKWSGGGYILKLE
jgi:hypothetical protein